MTLMGGGGAPTCWKPETMLNFASMIERERGGGAWEERT